MRAATTADAPDVPDTTGKKWMRIAIAFVIGLGVGPFLTGAFGLQITSGAFERQFDDAVVEEEARMCGLMVLEHEADISRMDYLQRRAVAAKYAKFPWSQADLGKVTDRCASELGSVFNYSSGGKS